MPPKFLQLLKNNFALKWAGAHGYGHWQRVLQNGLLLAPRTGANERVVVLFAYLHDLCRVDEYDDPDHGHRSADFASSLNGKYFDLSEEELGLLDHAIRAHADGLTTTEPTIGTCWDADRLDLSRVGILPNIAFLSTQAAKDCISGSAWRV